MGGGICGSGGCSGGKALRAELRFLLIGDVCSGHRPSPGRKRFTSAAEAGEIVRRQRHGAKRALTRQFRAPLRLGLMNWLPLFLVFSEPLPCGTPAATALEANRPPLRLRGSRAQPENASMDWRVSQQKFGGKERAKTEAKGVGRTAGCPRGTKEFGAHGRRRRGPAQFAGRGRANPALPYNGNDNGNGNDERLYA